MGSPMENRDSVEDLRLRLAEAEQTIEAIRCGEVDSLLVEGPGGLRIYALEGSSNTYRVLMEAMSEGAATLNEEGVILYSNGRFARMVDTPLQRVMASPLSAFVPERLHAELEALLRSARQEEVRGEFTLLAGGEEMPVYLSVNAIEEDGRPVLCLIATDLRGQKRSEALAAAEKRARENEERLRLALEGGKLGVWDWDFRSGSFTLDERCRRIFGLPPHAAVTLEGLASRLHPEDRQRVLDAVRGRDAEDVSAQYRISSLGGRMRWVEARARLRRDLGGEPVRMAGVLIDITERKLAEEAHRESDERRNQFLAMLSHELRNPLAPIKISLYLLQRSEPGSEQAQRAHAVIERQVGQLSRLVDDLLDVTRISRNKIELKREILDITDLVQRTVEDHRGLFQQSGVALELQCPGEAILVDGDRTRLAQALGNLLQNAAKFTPVGGRATVSLSRDSVRGWAAIRISDSGAGVAPDMLPHLFEAFSQADRTLDRSKGGLGLGLALVKGVVEMHGGKVRASSEGPGKGAQFLVCLPLKHGSLQQPVEPRAPGVPVRRRVLIVEDNRDAADSLGELLKLSGHDIEVSYAGEDALQRARQFGPDVVLCDIGLPGMDGYALARAFRQDPQLKFAYLVALSGYALPEDLQRAREASFDRHLTKPASLDKLQELIETIPGPRTSQ